MKIEICWSLCTDGDFGISNKEKYGLLSSYCGGEEIVGKKEIIEENKELCIYHAVRVLFDMIDDISYNKFSEMVDPIIRFIEIGKPGAKSNTIGGNYDGTCIFVIISE